MSHHKLEAKDLHYSYPDGHKAVNGMSFCIYHGESVGIIGANGAGKSTLLMLLMGVFVYDDVAFGPRNYKLDEKEVEKRVLQALELVGILHLKDRAPFKLSGGEKRAAAIASVLSMQPDILVMDEPTAALDPKSRRRVMELLTSFKHTKIITSHDLDMIFEMCDRTIVIKNGEIAADGVTSEILVNADLMDKCGLEVPLAMQNCPVCRTKKI
ncbi:energy-coupling factor ABC transporter ATP-binding protein [Desulfosporosinus sp. BICA1-9]|uniref:energy-coupling factor ABC transporter ATP-binding protein n=1 Tax=Desulfosporosinus sp. BICA1-9 TaxID=1531958 RepID=UPI00054C0600|nr:ABC transporter ATP-binding protein [Desulfosporosinus sp. BICA1-9]KJS49102.1 MAG: cobalt ABC transporter ATP-binding protein [Peptococcaceae bacterium BRH_c23]KJS81503.1 MAG: cobalt ABC transporter ATP-binding protein [Desulfosporosinus sp. BICA1-9]HBW35223.1 ABC transporter ATP-binding protein [Desulfosporosinus sp.]